MARPHPVHARLDWLGDDLASRGRNPDMVTINPADCLPHEVYEGTADGERWTMRRAFPEAEHYRWHMSRVRPGLTGIYSRRVGDADVSSLVRLVPARPVTREDRGELWSLIRDELRGVYPSISDQDHRKLDLAASAAADAVVAHLNANGGVPQSSDGVYGIPREDYEYVDWPATCAAEIERADRAETDRDRWRRAHEIVEQERNQAREQWKKWEYKANEWRERAEAAEARTAPVVTREDVEKAIRAAFDGGGTVGEVREMTDTVCRLLGIEAEPADPVEQKAVAAFKEAWHEADKEGDAGNRTVRGIRAARHVLGQEVRHVDQ